MTRATHFHTAAGGQRFRPVRPGETGAVAWLVTAIPVARDGRDKGLTAVSGE